MQIKERVKLQLIKDALQQYKENVETTADVSVAVLNDLIQEVENELEPRPHAYLREWIVSGSFYGSSVTIKDIDKANKTYSDWIDGVADYVTDTTKFSETITLTERDINTGELTVLATETIVIND